MLVGDDEALHHLEPLGQLCQVRRPVDGQAPDKGFPLLEEDLQATVDIAQLPHPGQRLLFGRRQLAPSMLSHQPGLESGPARLQALDLGVDAQPAPDEMAAGRAPKFGRGRREARWAGDRCGDRDGDGRSARQERAARHRAHGRAAALRLTT
ncbi:MAG: hypothetical protein A2790_21270 [Phenylobacterium sp. RIFCSPHIGHO2_01_FULL_69_31]|nr:MAG: hypothetical protein A2790_21270 [Phenylobacterium sp. RIFCSPHIGHO2_01_FULL_69_31]